MHTPEESCPVTQIDPSDIRCRVLPFAILAPSPHNTQPWNVSFLGKERIVLSIDRERCIPGCDPLGRQAFISLGAFLENLDLAAKSFGFHADIDLFPGGWPDGKIVPDTPVAHVDMVEDQRVEYDPLFRQIPLRHTNRRTFRRDKVPLSLAGEITAAYDYSLVPLGFSHDAGLMGAVADLASTAMKIELADRERWRETVHYFRFTDAEARQSPDGFGLAQAGYGKVARFFIGKFFLSRKKAASSPSSFSRLVEKNTRAQAVSAGGMGWLSTKGDFRTDQVRAGRAFQRVHLKATELGLALHPFTQFLADYPEMATLRSSLYEYLGIPDTHTVQMLFRMGYASPVPAAPRRDIHEFLLP
ncbi:MAG: nitroreductase family protein [Methanolinea sp.]|nr:nitroreductase family protein [Methanolinea sp.]